MRVLTRFSSSMVLETITNLTSLLQNNTKLHRHPAPAPPVQLQRRLTADEEADAVSKYQTGASMAELARELGVHKATVSRLLDRAGIPKRQPGLGSDQLEEAIELYADGWSLAAIGRRFKVDGHTVAARLREAGIEIRATGRRC